LHKLKSSLKYKIVCAAAEKALRPGGRLILVWKKGEFYLYFGKPGWEMYRLVATRRRE